MEVKFGKIRENDIKNQEIRGKGGGFVKEIVLGKKSGAGKKFGSGKTEYFIRSDLQSHLAGDGIKEERTIFNSMGKKRTNRLIGQKPVD